jgi:hypothetical protein
MCDCEILYTQGVESDGTFSGGQAITEVPIASGAGSLEVCVI